MVVPISHCKLKSTYEISRTWELKTFIIILLPVFLPCVIALFPHMYTSEDAEILSPKGLPGLEICAGNSKIKFDRENNTNQYILGKIILPT